MISRKDVLKMTGVGALALAAARAQRAVAAGSPTVLAAGSLNPTVVAAGSLNPPSAARQKARLENAPSQVLEAFSREELPAVRAALELLAAYLDHLRLDGSALVRRAHARIARSTMLIDPATRRHLDLLSGAGENSRASLLNVLSRTKTPMGSRMLAAWLCAPLLDVERIAQRHDRVAHLAGHPSRRQALRPISRAPGRAAGCAAMRCDH